MANIAKKRVRSLRHELSSWKELLGSTLAGLGTRLNPTLKGFVDVGRAEIAAANFLGQSQVDLIGEQLANVYERHLFVNTCVHYLAVRMASVPLRFYRKTVTDGADQLAPADDAPIARAFAYWNAQQSDFEAWEWLHSYSLLQGIGYAAIVRRDENTPDGIPFELYPLFPKWLEVIRSTQSGVALYRYRGDGGERIFLPHEVIAVRDFSTGDRFTGMGRMHAGRREINTDLKIREWNERLVGKGVHISGTLTTEDSLSPEAVKKIREEWERRYQGADSAGAIMVLHGGLEFNPTTLAHKDIHYIEQLELGKKDIAMAFGIPIELLGEKSANHASLREKRRIFWQDTVRSRLMRVERALNSSVLPRYAPGIVCAFDYSDVDALKPDFDRVVDAGAKAIASGQYTINEWRREKLNLPPIDGGDVLFIGRGLLPVEAAVNEGALVASRAYGETVDSEHGVAIRTAAPSLARALRSFNAKADVVSIEAQQYLDDIAKLTEQSERKMQLLLQKQLHNSEREIVEMIGSAADVVAESERVVLVEESRAIVARSEETLRRASERASETTAFAVGLEGAVDLRNTAAEEVLKGHARRIKDISTRRWLRLRNELVEALQSGESEDAMKKRVRSFFRGERNNALTIARTETAQAVNSASYSTVIEARKKGIDVRLEWNTVLDEKTRDDGQFNHAEAHKLTINPETERFIVGGEALRFPGDSENGSPANTINCRCAIRPVVAKGR